MTTEASAMAMLARQFELAGPFLTGFLGHEERRALANLKQAGAVRPAPVAPSVPCPRCEAFDVRPRAGHGSLRCRCPACGVVTLPVEYAEAVEVCPTWVVSRVRAALRIYSSTHVTEVIPRSLWRVGDLSTGERVALARGLRDPKVQAMCVTALAEEVALRPVVITADPGFPRLPAFPAQIRGLGSSFHLRDGALHADPALWANDGDAAKRTAAIHGPFSADFRYVTVPESVEPIELTATQARFFEALWKNRSRSVEGKRLMAAIGSAQVKPSDLFPSNKPGFEASHQVYKKLVRAIGKTGRYELIEIG